MEQILIFDLKFYAPGALFCIILLFLSIRKAFQIIKELIKEFDSKAVKDIVILFAFIALNCFFIWTSLFQSLYPTSLAYYEYKNDFVEQAIGVVDFKERDKDRLFFIIDGEEYTMVYRDNNTAWYRIDEGETVTFTYGVKSKYIFEIQQLRGSP